MKKIIITSLIGGIFAISCNKNSSTIDTVPTDSIQHKIDSTHTALPDSTIGYLEEEPELGKVIFTEQGNTIISFNTLENRGKIKINNDIIELTQLVFTEDKYEIIGENISIIAENGDFQDSSTNSDCNEGFFKKIIINYKNTPIEISNIKVENCPQY